MVPPTTRDELPEQRGVPGAPASWGMRAAARIIDFVLISLPFAFLSSAMGVKEISSGPDKGELTGPLWVLLLFPLVYMAYETLLVSRTGQTVGKWLCRVKVVDWSTGGLLTPQQAATAILKGWAQGQFEIHFPKRFTLWLKALRILPNRVFFQLVRRLAL
jgi:uncharacterized RDD family membrane protein YckC